MQLATTNVSEIIFSGLRTVLAIAFLATPEIWSAPENFRAPVHTCGSQRKNYKPSEIKGSNDYMIEKLLKKHP